MDRRLQIQCKIGEITEEQNLLQSYLEKVVSQVHSCVDLVNKSNKFKNKDRTLVLKYELDVLKKITDMVFELECIIDQSPLDQLKTTMYDHASNVVIQPMSRIDGTSTTVEIQDSQELSQELESSNATCSPNQTAEPVTDNCDVKIENNFSDTDIENLRDCLKKFNAKLELNQEYISSMTDMYQKSSSSFTEYYDKPSTSEIAQSKIDSANLGLQNSVTGFEIPEKDTNNAVSVENDLQEACIDGLQSLQFSTEDVSSATNENIKSESETVTPAEFEINDDSSSTHSSSDPVTETSSSDKNMTNEASHCLIPLVDEQSVLIGNVVDEGHNKTDDNAAPTNTFVCTALEKLNNLKVFDRQAEVMAKMPAPNQPDISLKPTEHRIKNNLKGNEKKIRKKKNKKCKEGEFYELKLKATPTRGMDCVFSHIESPNEFYIHVVDEESIYIDGLTEQLNDMFTGTTSEYVSKENAFNSIGTFCFCFVSSYNSWHRAQILDWELESKLDDVVVQFVDYGDKRRTSYKNLRRMTKEMSQIPMLAVRCHLSLMYPPESTYTNRLTDWPEVTIEAMMNISGLMGQKEGEREKIFRIVFANQEGNSVSVDMYNLQDREECTIGQVLLDLELAVQFIDVEEQEQPELEEFLQDVDSLERADNINEAVMGYDPKDEIRICRFTKSDGTCYKGKNCKLEHVPLSRDGFTTDKEPVFKEAMDSLTLPEKGKLVTVLITGYKDVCNFFAQIIRRLHHEKKYIIDEDLYLLLADINNAKTIRTYEAFKIAPAIGEIVIVKHWSKKYLRAVVREEIMENDDQPRYQVFTVDFGEYLTVPLDDLRKIKPHFLQLPFQAVECYMYNSVARDDCDKKSAEIYFSRNLYYHNFVARTMSSSLPLKLALMTFDNRDVGKMVIKEGFAKDRSCDFNPADNYFLELF